MIECGVCKNTSEAGAFLFRNMPPIAQNLPDEAALSSDSGINLKLCSCPYCGTVFLDAEPVGYYREVIRAVGVSEEIKSAKYKQLSEFCGKYDLADKRVIEIGCGDGAFLEILAKCTPNACGLEYSAAAVEECRRKGLNVYQGFIEGEDYRVGDERFDGFLLLMFLEHIPKPRPFLKGLYHNLAEGATGLIEVPDAEMILSRGLYAEIMRDHLYYYNLPSLSLLLNSCGFDIIENNTIRGGYVLGLTVRKRAAAGFGEIAGYIETIRARFQEVLCQYEEVVVWGASHQTFFVLSQIGETGKISRIVDSAEFKQGRYSPVTHIPICQPSPDHLGNGAVIVCAGSYNEEIANILRSEYGFGGDVYIFKTDALVKHL
ncbi:MAG: methyltransferase domain-containing protein [Lachnospiraceae bacterium]|jgi:cyclopropane fatty-acyl-phospholipid synthase-like methyltransferase|nr:methyltransferase domain-containing protein [Lachnospiraceae bacterium]